MIFAIDPGNECSAYVIWEEHKILSKGIVPNERMLGLLQPNSSDDLLAVEMIASYGMPVGKTTFETCVWIGRYIERWYPAKWKYVYRLDVKMALCHDSRAKDGNIRQAIIDRFSDTGGGSTPQIGTKKKPGPLYGVSKDIWSALGVALTVQEQP